MNEVCGDSRFEVIAKAKEDIIKSTNIEASKDEMKCLDSFLFRCWQMGWLKQYESTSEEVSGLVNYAVDEMARLGWMDEETDPMQKEIVKCVLDLIKAFDSQGHSGFSAPYCLNLFNRLANWKPISPLTGKDDEWKEAWGDPNLYQNKRYSAVFKEKSTGRVYNCEGKIFTRDNGNSWFIGKDSFVDIAFPYVVPDEPEEVYLESETELG